MARFDVDFAHVRQHGDIVAVLAHYNVKLIGDGNQRKAKCPLHEDGGVSLSVNVSKRLFNCHSCGSGGNIIKLVQLLDPKLANPRRAALRVAELSGIAAKADGAPKKVAPLTLVAGTEVDNNAPPAREREQANDNDEDGVVINRPLTFELKLAPVEPESDSPASRFVKDRGIPFERLAELGIGVAMRGSMKDRLAIGIHNKDGELVAYCGRDVGLLGETKVEKYKYPPKFHRALELFGWHHAQNFDRVVLVSSVLDVIKHGGVLQDRGEASLGIAALMDRDISPAQIELLQETSPDIIVCLGSDEAGETAAQQVAGKLASTGLWVTVCGEQDWKPQHDEPAQFYKRCSMI